VGFTGFADFFSSPKFDVAGLGVLFGLAPDLAPDFADYSSSLIDSWSGGRPFTPSSFPIIGPSDIGGVFFYSGPGFYGWTLSFASGEGISTYF
jgi:Glycine/D-amino acid oxidases (deaminating)